MDPNETLHALREEISDYGDTERIAELFQALDNWLSNGGFLPDAWHDGTPDL